MPSPFSFVLESLSFCQRLAQWAEMSLELSPAAYGGVIDRPANLFQAGGLYLAVGTMELEAGVLPREAAVLKQSSR